METKEKTWNYKFLVLEALGIIFVVVGHNQPINVFFNNVFLFYQFHMALFAFVSGYFFLDYGVKEFLEKKTKKLIGVYIIWNCIYGIVVNILRKFNVVNYGNDFNLYNILIAPFIGDSNQFGFNAPAWFMISLYFIQLIYFFINKLMNKLKIRERISTTLITIVFASIILSLYQRGILQNEYWKLLIRVAFLLPFYLLGVLYKTYERYDKLNSYYVFTITIIEQAILLQKFNRIDYNLNTFFLGKNYIIYLIASINGIVFWLRISDIIARHFENNKVIEYIGKNTLPIMMHHLFCEFLLNFCVLILNKKIHILNNFSQVDFQNNIWYKYDNSSNGAINLIYAIIGITIPILIEVKFLDKLKKIGKGKAKNNEKITN